MLPAGDSRISAPFGVRGPWAAGYHTGTDFACNIGTPVYATKGGVVVFAGYSGGWGTAYGYHVIISSYYNGRMIRHMYAHMSSYKVRYGDRVKDGQYIGLSGNSGNTSGPHVHYEERHKPYGYYDHHRPVLLDYQPKPTVSLRALRPGKTNRSVLKLKNRLNEYFPKKTKLIGPYFSKALQERYAEYQRHLGYSGKEANGIPGRLSLQKLGFRVIS